MLEWITSEEDLSASASVRAAASQSGVVLGAKKLNAEAASMSLNGDSAAPSATRSTRLNLTIVCLRSGFHQGLVFEV